MVTVKGAKSKTKPKPKSGIAAYTMYGFEWLRADVRVFWATVAERLRDAGMAGVPARLSWKIPEEQQWRAPNLLLGQTCGYPLMKGLTGALRLVATPSFDLPHVEGVTYRSLIVVAKDAGVTNVEGLRGRLAAVNKVSSHSGYNAFRRLIADYVHQAERESLAQADRAGRLTFFGGVEICGSHMAAMQAVAAGRADVAAIDAVSFHLIGRAKPELSAALRVLTTSLPAPGLPLVTAGGRSDEDFTILRAAVFDTLDDAKCRRALANMGINGFQVVERPAYQQILDFERQSEDLGYPVLA